jgi:hypothetical protein
VRGRTSKGGQAQAQKEPEEFTEGGFGVGGHGVTRAGTTVFCG